MSHNHMNHNLIFIIKIPHALIPWAALNVYAHLMQRFITTNVLNIVNVINVTITQNALLM